MTTKKRGPVSYTETAKAIMKGIKKARSDYIAMASEVDQDWPEYWVTVYVAEALWKHFGKGGFVTVETSTQNVLTRRRGQPRRDTKSGRKYDIVLWKKNGDARAIVEIKHQQGNTKLVMGDVKRIAAALEQGTKLEFGAVGYYYDQLGDDTRNAVHNYREKLFDEAKETLKGTKCRVIESSKSKSAYYMPNEKDDCWIAGCMTIRRKAGVRKK